MREQLSSRTNRRIASYVTICTTQKIDKKTRELSKLFPAHSLLNKTNFMSLKSFLKKIKNNEAVSFTESIQVITESYHYQPVEFSNGIGDKKLTNAQGTNEGSCKIFSFAKINQLNQQQTLCLFGDFYRKDVMEDPTGNGHQNIRNFMQFGWEGISFTEQALTEKTL